MALALASLLVFFFSLNTREFVADAWKHPRNRSIEAIVGYSILFSVYPTSDPEPNPIGAVEYSIGPKAKVAHCTFA